MPTRMGGYLNGLIFLMFLLSVGYNNNLLLIFTLFLFGFNLMWVIQTHFHLHALKVDSVIISEGHAGEALPVMIHWKKTPEGPHAWKLALENESEIIPVSNLNTVTFPARGLKKFSYLSIVTDRPFGLYKVWVFQKIESKVIVYPAKLSRAPEIKSVPTHLEGDQSSALTGPHDVRNLAPYQGEESRKISWKHYAKSGELVIKEGEELIKSEVHFRVPQGHPEMELLLSGITTQMVNCARQEIVFSLETPTRKTRSGNSLNHLSDCLRELAVC